MLTNPKSGDGGNMCASVVDGDHNNGGGEATVCSLADFVGWSDFPKGLRILLLDHDNASAAETKSKLEQMDYVVSLFSSEKEAVEAILGRIGSFHVAIVEVNATNNQESFRFLETARGLPTVMVSNGNCLSTMMKCIALGAVEILQKPLSEEKIKNIWQHAVHKAFNAGENALAKSLKPIRETVSTMFELQPDTWKNANGVPEDGTTGREGSEKEHANRLAGYGLPSPSTPQAEQGIRSLDAGDSRGPSSHSSAEHECEVTCKDTADFTFSCSESKFVDITRIGSNGDNPEEESMKTDPPKESAMSSDSKNEHFLESVSRNPVRKEPSPNHVLNHSGSKNGRKKTKVDWTAELHRRFVRAVEQLGIDQAIPSKILALMKVEGLTRHNIASHLQKYRMQRNNAFPKDGGRWWVHRRDSSSRAYAQKPVLAMPPPHSNFGSPQPVYPAWGHPQFHPSGSQLWGHAGFYPWHQGSWPWKSRTRMHADAWGCPVFSPQNDYSTMTTKICQNVPLTKITPDHNRGGGNIHEPQLTEDVIDEVVKEAISKPWLPLPIGLKPPSTDSVLAELHLQGIHSMPPNPCHRPRSQA